MAIFLIIVRRKIDLLKRILSLLVREKLYLLIKLLIAVLLKYRKA